MIQHTIDLLTCATTVMMACLAVWLMLLKSVPKRDDDSSASYKHMLRERSFRP